MLLLLALNHYLLFLNREYFLFIQGMPWMPWADCATSPKYVYTLVPVTVSLRSHC